MFAYPETVTVQTAPALVDPYSGEATDRDWSAPVVRDEFCGVGDPRTGEPLLDGRVAVDADFTLYFDHDPGVTSADRIVVRGHVCEVAGHPFGWQSPFTGWAPGWVVHVKVREG